MAKFTCPKCAHSFEPSRAEVQSRVGRSNRARGASFERRVAKKLEAWWGKGVQFRRTPQSGGSALKEGFDLAGDLACNDPGFRLHLECKNYATFKGIQHSVLTERYMLYDWLDQANRDAPPGKAPVVLFQCENKQFLVSDWHTPIETTRHLILPSRDNDGYLHMWSFEAMLKMDPEIWRTYGNYHRIERTPQSTQRALDLHQLCDLVPKASDL